jgi:Flp pilus assembly protein TadD
MLRPDQRLGLGFPLLSDPVRGVRIEAARVLAATPTDTLTPAQRDTLDAAIDEFVDATLTDSDRPAAHLNLGVFLTDRGDLVQAEAEYRTALRLNRRDARAYVNLSDLYRAQGRDDLCEATLREALAIVPDAAPVHHALGLLLVRQGKMAEAIEALRAAVVLEADNARFRYVYAIALNARGSVEESLAELAIAHRQHPYERDVLVALATGHRDHGSIERAMEYARQLVELAPQRTDFRELWRQIESLNGKR